MQFLWFPVRLHCVPGLCGKFLLQSLLQLGGGQRCQRLRLQYRLRLQLRLQFQLRLRLLQYHLLRQRFRLQFRQLQLQLRQQRLHLHLRLMSSGVLRDAEHSAIFS